MSAEDENRQQAEEDAQEDIELRDHDADKVTGGRPDKTTPLEGDLSADIHFK